MKGVAEVWVFRIIILFEVSWKSAINNTDSRILQNYLNMFIGSYFFTNLAIKKPIVSKLCAADPLSSFAESLAGSNR